MRLTHFDKIKHVFSQIETDHTFFSATNIYRNTILVMVSDHEIDKWL